MPKINQAGLDLIKSFEGCYLYVYDDKDQHDPHPIVEPGDAVEGTLTIGWGHTGDDVVPGLRWTQADADSALEIDLGEFERDVQRLVEIELTPNQFAALVSFDYNTGALGSSPGLGLINSHNFEAAWDNHFCLYIHDADGNELPGLIRRRAAEKALFFA